MVKLFCAIVDGAGSAFSVRVDESDSVDELKDAIKEKKPDTIKGEADKLQLFLTKTNDGAWLESDSEDVKKLKKGEKSIAIKALTGEDKELQGESGLQKVLAGMSKPSTDQIHVLVVVPKPEQALWLITGFVENAMYSKRIRSYLHWMATFRIGYYDPVLRTQNKNVAFWYEGKNLCLHLLFETKKNAMLFETDLRTGPQTLGSPLYDKEVVAHVAPINFVPAELQRVFNTDYASEEFDSPSNSITSISNASNVDISTDEFEYQRIEHKKLFLPYSKAECCHLVSKKQSRDHIKYAEYGRDLNNRLALSRDMHGWYDGISAEIPIVNMLPGSVDKNSSIGNRRKVEVFVKVVDAQCTDRVFSRLKEGSIKTDDPLVMKTFVHVENPTTFCFCMRWKHEDNDELWKSYFDMTPALV